MLENGVGRLNHSFNIKNLTVYIILFDILIEFKCDCFGSMRLNSGFSSLACYNGPVLYHPNERIA